MERRSFLLPEELPGAGGFVGRSTTEPLVLACTIQRAGLSAKVKADLEKITSQGQPVARVAYFMTQNMPVNTGMSFRSTLANSMAST